MQTSITFDDISSTFLSTSELSSIIDFLNGIELQATFFVVPDGGTNHSFNEEFASCLRAMRDLGHEVSLHGYKHVKNEFGYFYPIPLPVIPIPSFAKQRERIELGMKALKKLSGGKPLGFRSPFYLYNKMTHKALSSLGFRYDSSTTVFKPAHGARFRIRWSGKCGPYRTNGLIEIPVTGDYTYHLTRTSFLSSLRRALRDFEWVRYRDGAFVINFHPNRTNKDLLAAFIKSLSEKLRGKTEFVRLADMHMC